MDSILNWIYQIFSNFSPSILFLCVVFFGMFVCWRGAIESRKDRSSVFDLFLISIFLGFLLGRIIHIVSNYQDFSGYIWYWLPYEKYGEQVYWFRLLPWRFFNIFDGGLNILSMFVMYLFSASFWSSIVKKWRWNQMFPTIYFSGEIMLALSFVLLGLNTANASWIVQGGILLLFPVISVLLITFVNKIRKPLFEKRLYFVANLLLIVLSVGVITYIYISGDLDIYGKITLYAFLTWTVFGLIIFIKDSRKANVVIEKVSSVREIDINHPIKFPKR